MQAISGNIHTVRESGYWGYVAAQAGKWIHSSIVSPRGIKVSPLESELRKAMGLFFESLQASIDRGGPQPSQAHGLALGALLNLDDEYSVIGEEGAIMVLLDLAQAYRAFRYKPHYSKEEMARLEALASFLYELHGVDDVTRMMINTGQILGLNDSLVEN
jgi:hypothetical protein